MHWSGVITLTTDFGHKGPFAAVMRGVILSRMPNAQVVDLAHDIPPQWPPEAGFWINRAYRYFPAGSIHLGIVDPGVGTERDIIVVECDGHVFMAPDNGLLAELLGCHASAVVRRLDATQLTTVQLPTRSDTFHGRDIFAPIAAELASNRLSFADIGPIIETWTPGWLDEPVRLPGKISGCIVTIDAFGNLISNIDAALVDEFAEPVANIAGRQIAMLSTYGRAQPGDFLALKNSFGVIEIAKAEGNAADGLGLERGAPLLIADGYST
jgi:S-adenosylmethionine hydrolase